MPCGGLNDGELVGKLRGDWQSLYTSNQIKILRPQKPAFARFRGGQLAFRARRFCRPVVGAAGRFGFDGHAFERNANLFADADDALGFLVGGFIKLAVFVAQDKDAHFVVVHLAELVQGLAKAGADM